MSHNPLLRQILDIYVNIDRYKQFTENGESVLIPTDDGDWVPFEQVKSVVDQLVQRVSYLQGQLNQKNGILSQLQSRSNSISTVTACPRCEYPQEEDGMRRKECPSCEFVWLANTGY